MKSSELNKKMKKKIISVAYNDTNLMDKISVYLSAQRNEAIRAELKNCKRIAEAVHSLEDECPEELLTHLKLNNIPAPKTKNSIIVDFISILINKPAASALTVVALILTITISVILNRPVQKQYTESEIELANKQTRYALSLIGNIMNETKEKLENEVIKEHVVKPISSGIELVNKLFIKGE